ncbi:MAG: D-sedoheptulose-7-phosphate isomerase [Armatimonadota bacterium]
MDTVKDYLDSVAGLLSRVPKDDIRNVANLIMEAYTSGKQVFIMGNGGSASTASHLACDLQKSIGFEREQKFKVMSLTDNIPLMTAWANDTDYSNVFVQQLSTWLNPNDLVIGISASGNSPNVLRAMELANEKGATTIALCGFHGGKLGKIAEHSIIVESENMQHIEDVHMVLAHLIFRYILEGVSG